MKTPEVARQAANDDLAVKAAFQSWFGLQLSTTRVLAELYRGGDRPVELARRAEVGAASLVQHHIPRLRQALDDEAIDYAPGEGYRLTEAGRAECLAVLWQIGEELRRAS